jgi:hypothetical protein
MNDRLQPLSRDDVDLLLSADLDGDLDAAAADLDLSPSEARDRLAATPGADARRAALARARDESATPVAALSDEQRAALVSNALGVTGIGHSTSDDLTARRDATHDARRALTVRRARVASLVAAAAAVIVVLGVVAVMSGSGDDRDDSGSALAPTERAPDDDLPYLGDISEPEQLRAALERGVDGAAAPTSGAESAPGAEDESANSDTTDQQASGDANATRLSAAAVDPCLIEVAQTYADGAEPVTVASARYNGALAAVAVFEIDGRELAIVFAPGTCEPLLSQLVT